MPPYLSRMEALWQGQAEHFDLWYSLIGGGEAGTVPLAAGTRAEAGREEVANAIHPLLC